jgi:hypothetical protein
MAEQDFLGEIMNFNPQDLTVFQNNNDDKPQYDQNIYKTNPVAKDLKVASEDGHYRSTVRILYNPFDVKRSIVDQTTYYISDAQGSLLVRSSLADGDKNCPIFKAWKKLWFSGDEAKKEFAKKMFERSESRWVLVQIMEDANRPELVGKFMVWKLPTVVFEKLQAKMNPSPESKKAPVALMDYLLGPALEIDVTPGPDDPKNPSRKQREISYSLCDFGTDAMPITKVDGSPLFTDAELETIDAYATAKANMEKAKTDAKKEAAKKEALDLVPAMKEIYAKALDYLKANAVNLVNECAYHPYSDEVAKRIQNWCDIVAQGLDPKSTTITEGAAQVVVETAGDGQAQTVDEGEEKPKDLPF